MSNTVNITGQRFGHLVVIEPTDQRTLSNGYVIWRCKCDCGNICYCSTNKLNTGCTKSCGCKSSRTTKFHILKSKTPNSNTSGHKGVHRLRDKWRAYITYKYQRYYLLYSCNINDCIAIRQEAEQAVADGCFEQWIKDYKGKRSA